MQPFDLALILSGAAAPTGEGTMILRDGVPVLRAWLTATSTDLKALPGRTVAQYGIYWRHGQTRFLAIDPRIPSEIETARVIRSVQKEGQPESGMELVCVHLDNGDQFYIRPEDAYAATDRLDRGWRSWVNISRGAITPVID